MSEANFETDLSDQIDRALAAVNKKINESDSMESAERWAHWRDMLKSLETDRYEDIIGREESEELIVAITKFTSMGIIDHLDGLLATLAYKRMLVHAQIGGAEARFLKKYSYFNSDLNESE